MKADKRKIGVFPPKQFRECAGLFQALAQLFPVEFVEYAEEPDKGLEAILLLEATRQRALAIAKAGVRCYAVLEGATETVHLGSAPVKFETVPPLHQYFMGQTLMDDGVQDVSVVKLMPQEKIICSKRGYPLWVFRSEGRKPIDFVMVGPPKLPNGSFLFQYFRAKDFMRLLPLLHFLREVSEMNGWVGQGVRATFMFDDPNLHSLRYGFLDFRELVEHAKAYNYHVSIATIPLDSWWVSSGTAALFRENRDRISLLIHGNNHTKRELAQPISESDKARIMGQALRRIAKLENRAGVEVSRVMAAPHGACSEDMTRILLLLNFEAACISLGSLMAHNPNRSWPATAGLEMAEFLAGGLPVISRFGPGQDSKAEVLLRAFLNRPVICVAHHDEIEHGLAPLDEIAQIIGTLDRPVWMDMKGIARSNFLSRVEGESLSVKMYSRRIALKVPDGVSSLTVERPWMRDVCSQQKLIIRSTISDVFSGMATAVSPCIPVQACDTLEISSLTSGALDFNDVPAPAVHLWPIARRLLSEIRDRALPVILRRTERLKCC